MIDFPVGILRPDWLKGATFKGQEDVDGFQCNRWEKADFITYWAGTKSGLPVKWEFHVGSVGVFHVMRFLPGEELPLERLQAPRYCFDASNSDALPSLQVL